MSIECSGGAGVLAALSCLTTKSMPEEPVDASNTVEGAEAQLSFWHVVDPLLTLSLRASLSVVSLLGLVVLFFFLSDF